MSQKGNFILLVVIGVVFIAGIFAIMQRRFSQGQDYPHGSSHRAAEDGARAFYESLNSLNGIKVERITDPLAWGNRNKPRTIFAIGVRKWMLTEEDGDLHAILINEVYSGARLVVALTSKQSVFDRSEFDNEDKPKQKVEEENKEPATELSNDDDHLQKSDQTPTDEPVIEPENNSALKGETVDATIPPSKDSLELMGIKIHEIEKNSGLGKIRATEIAKQDGLESWIEWNPKLRLETEAPEWSTLYTEGVHPVITERCFGRGSIVFLADDSPLTNQTLKDSETRSTHLLTYLIGDNTEVAFCETIHNIYDEDSITRLMRRYRLHGLILGMALAFFLVIWRNSLPVIPPSTEGDDMESPQEIAAMGTEQSTGFSRLLQKHLADKALPGLALRLWEKSFSHRPRFRHGSESTKLMKARNLVSTFSGKSDDMPKLFRELHSLLNTKGK